jgi:hypothetical protein
MKPNLKPVGKSNKLSVSERAVLQRINRNLRPDTEVRKTRDSLVERNPTLGLRYGGYHMVNCRVGSIDEYDVDLETLGRELGVLHDWERVQAE